MSEHTQLANNLLQVTSEGRLADWTERMGAIARNAGVDLTWIDWNACPRIVADNIVNIAKLGRWEALARAIEEWRNNEHNI